MLIVGPYYHHQWGEKETNQRRNNKNRQKNTDGQAAEASTDETNALHDAPAVGASFSSGATDNNSPAANCWWTSGWGYKNCSVKGFEENQNSWLAFGVSNVNVINFWCYFKIFSNFNVINQ